MAVIKAKYSGFCFGVARAVKLLNKSLESGKKTYCIGEMIHNPVFNAEVCRRGLVIISEDELDKIEKGSNVIIRSHGLRHETEDELRKIDCEVIDATCPDVKKIHRIIDENTNENTLLIMIGNPTHPEVRASVSYCRGKCAQFANFSEFKANFNCNLIFSKENVIMVAQTTHSVSDYEKCKEFLKKLCTNAKIFDTICSVTELRQSEASELSETCDAMLIIGGKSSSNTLKLFDICKHNCENTFFVENVSDIPHLCGELNIGIVAGASTPNDLIEEVINKCQSK